MKKIILPVENAKEAAIVMGIKVIGVENLRQVVEYLNKKIDIEPTRIEIENIFNKKRKYVFDFSEVKGQENIKRALEVSAARWTQCTYGWTTRIWKNNVSKEITINFTRFNF